MERERERGGSEREIHCTNERERSSLRRRETKERGRERI